MSCTKLSHIPESTLALLKDDSVQIDGCNCAAIGVGNNGAIMYDYHRLVEHFHDHEGMWEHDDEDEVGTTAVEWVDYNVIRGIAYISEGIRPIIVSEGIEWDEEDEED